MQDRFASAAHAVVAHLLSVCTLSLHVVVDGSTTPPATHPHKTYTSPLHPCMLSRDEAKWQQAIAPADAEGSSEEDGPEVDEEEEIHLVSEAEHAQARLAQDEEMARRLELEDREHENRAREQARERDSRLAAELERAEQLRVQRDDSQLAWELAEQLKLQQDDEWIARELAGQLEREDAEMRRQEESGRLEANRLHQALQAAQNEQEGGARQRGRAAEAMDRHVLRMNQARAGMGGGEGGRAAVQRRMEQDPVFAMMMMSLRGRVHEMVRACRAVLL